MKKLIAVFLVVVLALALFAGCSSGSGNSIGSGNGGNSGSSSNSNSGSSSGNSGNSADSGNSGSGSGSGNSGSGGSSGSGNAGAQGGGSGIPEVIWARNFNGGDSEGYFESVAWGGGGYVATGYALSASFGTGDWEGFERKGDTDAIIVKYDTDGNVLWRQNFGGYNHDNFHSVIWDGDGYIAVGNSELFSRGDWEGYPITVTPSGNGGPIIVKFSPDGDIVWQKGYYWGGEFNSVIQVSDGYVVAGISAQTHTDWEGFTANGDGDAIIAKLDRNGDVVWKNNIGGSSNDWFNSVTQVSDGFVAVGYAWPDSFGNGDWAGFEAKGKEDAIIAKFDASGGLVWAKTFGGGDRDMFESVAPSGDGYFVVGYSQRDSFETGDWTGVPGTGGYYDVILFKFDANGNVVWKRTLGGGGYTHLYTVIPDGDGYLACGYAGSIGKGDFEGIESRGGNDAILVKFDANGDVTWIKNFGGGNGESFESVIRADDYYIAVGSSSRGSIGNGDWDPSFTAKGSSDQIMVKFG